MSVYDGCKIYGPYLRKDGRQHVVVLFPSGDKKTVSYPKYLMEQKLNRFLAKNETVDHYNRDFTDDDLKNLKIKDRSTHAKEDVIRLVSKEFVCPIDNVKFILSEGKLSDAIANRLKNKSGPFCSRKCAGVYGAQVQRGRNKLKVKKINAEYFIREK